MKNSPRRLLVTGAAGFIGSHFVKLALRHPATEFVLGWDSFTYAGNPDNLPPVSDRFGIMRRSITDTFALQHHLDLLRIDGIVNFAAESHVDRSITDAHAFVDTNVAGVASLLAAARAQKRPPRFVQVSTDEVFGSLGSTGVFSETSPYAPNSPYAASKAGGDLLVRSFHVTHGLDTVQLHCSNNYGPNQFPEKLIPLTILNALYGKPIPVYGTGRNVRDWIHVHDHCAAIWEALHHAAPGSTYVIGADNEWENIGVVETLCDLVDVLGPPLPKAVPRRSLISFVGDRAGHDHRYGVDASKIRRELGWQPRTKWEDGLAATVGWYIANERWLQRIQSGDYRKDIPR